MYPTEVQKIFETIFKIVYQNENAAQSYHALFDNLLPFLLSMEYTSLAYETDAEKLRKKLISGRGDASVVNQFLKLYDISIRNGTKRPNIKDFRDDEMVKTWKASCPRYDGEELKTDLKKLFIDASHDVGQNTVTNKWRETILAAHTDKGCPKKAKNRDYLGIIEKGDKATQKCREAFEDANNAKKRMNAKCDF